MGVCAKCLSEPDIETWIRNRNGPRGCEYCRRRDAPTAELALLAEYMRGCLEQIWGLAIEQLPYESSEGGYQGETWDTLELLLEHCDVGFPRDGHEKLMYDLSTSITEEPWCDFDWLSLDDDEALKLGWNEFCEVVKHDRRFFFGSIAVDPDDRQKYSPSMLLQSISGHIERFGLVTTLPKGSRIYRARQRKGKSKRTAAELGPPPKELALQSNRMNPPGVPMLYGAESRQVAVLEVQADVADVGAFEIKRDAIILDLASLPNVPGIFAGVDRADRLGLRFLHHFRNEVVKPVVRDQRTHIEYIPTQIVTEYFRHHGIGELKLDGIRYPSSLVRGGKNVVLFATQEDVEGATALGPKLSDFALPPKETWIAMTGVRLVRAKQNVQPGR